MKKYLKEEVIDNFLDTYRVYLLTIILLGAFILRILFLDFDSMWLDETISALAAQGIIEHGYPVLESGASYSRSLLFHYIMAFFVLVFGGDFGARFISVIFGVLTVFLAYFFGKKYMGNSFTSLAFALLIAISALEIIYSKQARFYQAFQFFYFLSFYLFYKFIILREKYMKKRYYDYVLLALSVWATIHLQSFGYVMIPLFVLIYFIYNFDPKKKFSLLKDRKVLFFMGLSVLVFLYAAYDLAPFLFDFNLNRVELYANSYLNFLIGAVPLILFSIAGMALGLYRDWKFHSSFLIFALLPVLSLFLIETFATRYTYFALFFLFFYLVYFFENIYFKHVLFILLVIFYSTTVFTFTGIAAPAYDSSSPLSNFKGAYAYVERNESISDLPLLTTWAPAAVWYGDGADYWIKYSLTGFKNETWTQYNGRERFANATIVYSTRGLPQEQFVFVLDTQAKGKLGPSYLNFIGGNCTPSYASYRIEVLLCN